MFDTKKRAQNTTGRNKRTLNLMHIVSKLLAPYINWNVQITINHEGDTTCA